MAFTELSIGYHGSTCDVDLVDYNAILNPETMRRIWIKELCLNREDVSVLVPDIHHWKRDYIITTESPLIREFLDMMGQLDMSPESQVVDLEGWVRAARNGEFDEEAMEAWLEETNEADFVAFSSSYIGYFSDVSDFVDQLLEDHDVPDWLVYDPQATWDSGLHKEYFETGGYYFRKHF